MKPQRALTEDQAVYPLWVAETVDMLHLNS